MTITWHLETRQLKDLTEHPHNPRQLSKHDAEHLERSLEKFGQVEKLVINTDGQIIGGHQRKKILKKMGISTVECWVPDRTLEQKEVDELCIRLNKNTGEFDFDILANQWEMPDLLEWGFIEDDFGLKIDDEQEISLPSEDKTLTNITFTLSNDQAELVNRCLGISKAMAEFVETGNENSNGNALARICELWIADHGNS